MDEIVEIKPHLIAGSSDDLADLRNKTGFAERGQTHHLVLVAELGESKELRKGGVKEPEGVREMHTAADFKMIGAADTPHQAAKIAEAVDGNYGCFVEWRRKESAGKMGAVMFDVVDTDPVRAGDPGGTQIGGETSHSDGVVRAGSQATPIAGASRNASEFPPKMGARIPRDGDVTEGRRIDVGKTIAGGLHWKAGPVFESIEALLFNGGDEIAVGEQCRGGVTVEGV
jgi:hypothetical protein